MALIHHNTLKSAAKLGIELTVDVDTVVARDTLFNIDQEFSGMNAKELVARVLAARPQPEPKAKKAAKVAVREDADEDADEGEGEDADEADEGEDADADADEGEDTRTGSVVKAAYKAAYMPNDSTCGDDFAMAFIDHCRDADGGLDYQALIDIGHQNGVEVSERWGHLNPGMQRMNLSNVLRGMWRGGTAIKIATQTFEPVVEEAEEGEGEAE